MPVKCLSPSGMLTSGGRHAELLLPPNVDTLGRAGALGNPSRVDVRGRCESGLLGWTYSRIGLICLLLLKVLEEG